MRSKKSKTLHQSLLTRWNTRFHAGASQSCTARATKEVRSSMTRLPSLSWREWGREREALESGVAGQQGNWRGRWMGMEGQIEGQRARTRECVSALSLATINTRARAHTHTHTEGSRLACILYRRDDRTYLEPVPQRGTEAQIHGQNLPAIYKYSNKSFSHIHACTNGRQTDRQRARG